MAYKDFLTAFAESQSIGSVEELLNSHAERYSFQINSRERAKGVIATLDAKLALNWQGLRVLDVGCAYGAFTIELAKRGARVVGIDVSPQWLRLAQVNAQDEADVPFVQCDASSRNARQLLAEHGPFDIVLVNDVFEHIYDTAGLLANLRSLMVPGGKLFFKIPNGMATRHVLLEGHKHVFGISLLAPDYWQKFVQAPFRIYYRRWEYFTALFREFGFDNMNILNPNHDRDLEHTRQYIAQDVSKIRQHLKQAKAENLDQYKALRPACQQYFEEVEEDMRDMDWDALHFKYRVTFWEGLIQTRRW